MRATLLIYIDSTGMTVWMWIQSLSHYWKYQGNMLPSSPWRFPFYYSLQDSSDPEKENTRLTVNKDHVFWIEVITWRQRMDVDLLVESVFCLSLQTGCRGCTLETWYFGFPQQQQWMQDSMIMKRNVAERRHRRSRHIIYFISYLKLHLALLLSEQWFN